MRDLTASNDRDFHFAGFVDHPLRDLTASFDSVFHYTTCFIAVFLATPALRRYLVILDACIAIRLLFAFSCFLATYHQTHTEPLDFQEPIIAFLVLLCFAAAASAFHLRAEFRATGKENCCLREHVATAPGFRGVAAARKGFCWYPTA